MAKAKKNKTTTTAAAPDGAGRTLTTQDICARMGVHRRTVDGWAADGLPRSKRGNPARNYYDAAEVDAWLAAKGLTGQPGRPPDTDALSAFDVPAGADDDMKRRLARAELARRTALAQRYAFELDALKGKYILREEQEALTIKRILAVRSALMALPSRLTPLVLGRDAHDVQDLIEAECRRICDVFAGGGPAPDTDSAKSPG